ncbi:MAG: hypothetical protein M1429_02950 [Patescibacteria group bacterium]|nr:hypothetical protein [Patescibacteria group bacterium]
MNIETVEQFIKRKNDSFTKKNTINVKDIGRNGRHFFVREAWTFMPQGNMSDKVFVIERLRKDSYEGELSYKDSWNRGDIEYRVGYYIVGKIGRANGRWIWGQFCPIIPAEDFIKLLEKAKEEGTIKFDRKET